jgi:hypothetical protein
VIVDAGGGTVDISSYSRNLNSPKESFEEIAAPQCSLLFINLNFGSFLSLHTRSLPWLCFCYLPCKTILGEYVPAKARFIILFVNPST